jgi:hypothetical protein
MIKETCAQAQVSFINQTSEVYYLPTNIACEILI